MSAALLDECDRSGVTYPQIVMLKKTHAEHHVRERYLYARDEDGKISNMQSAQGHVMNMGAIRHNVAAVGATADDDALDERVSRVTASSVSVVIKAPVSSRAFTLCPFTRTSSLRMLILALEGKHVLFCKKNQKTFSTWDCVQQ